MSTISVRVDTDTYQKVVEHTLQNGSKIGKFYDIAVSEKLARDQKKPRGFKPKYETK